MYARKFSHNFVPLGPHNLKNIIPEGNNEKLLFNCSLILRRQFSKVRDVKEWTSRIQTILKHVKAYKMIIFSKSSPEKTLKVWAQQFEFVFAQRVRRGQQMFCLYSRWWEERALKEFLKKLRISFGKNGKEFIMGAIGVSLYNWDENRIKDEDIQQHLDDLEYIQVLKDQTVCLSCEAGDKSNTNTRICKCGTHGLTNKTYDDWVPFIEKDDLMVWRRPYANGLFEYKVYGSYYDVSAEDFLNVQVDTDYRKQWDTTAVQLEIGEQDPDPESNSDILYWEMQWPVLFVNRDYVFNRRYKVYNETDTIIIINKTTEYPTFPKFPDKYRVEEYWSCMVIKPYTEMDKPGIEFSLTYFDNPGVNVPSSVTTWVAKSAMPDFLVKLRNAGRKYKKYCLDSGTSKACEVIRKEDRERREAEEKNKLDYCSNDRLRLVDVLEDLQRIANEKFEKLFEKTKMNGSGTIETKVEKATTLSEEVSHIQQSNPIPTNSHSNFWKYLHPLYYFT